MDSEGNTTLKSFIKNHNPEDIMIWFFIALIIGKVMRKLSPQKNICILMIQTIKIQTLKEGLKGKFLSNLNL